MNKKTKLFLVWAGALMFGYYCVNTLVLAIVEDTVVYFVHGYLVVGFSFSAFVLGFFDEFQKSEAKFALKGLLILFPMFVVLYASDIYYFTLAEAQGYRKCSRKDVTIGKNFPALLAFAKKEEWKDYCDTSVARLYKVEQ